MRLIRKTNFDFLAKKSIGMILSLILILGGLTSLIIKGGPHLSIDFTHGTVFQVQFNEVPEISQIRSKLEGNGFEGAEVIEFGNNRELLIKTSLLENIEEANSKLNSAFFGMEYEIRKVEMVHPKIGKELKKDAIYAITLALIGIMIYIWFRFDRYYALGSVVALLHDVFITVGIFSILNKEVDLSIIAALLTIVGYSLNDTIVVFDRIRENIHQYSKEKLESVVNLSLNETLSRTVITSVTTLVVVVVLLLFGGEVINNFAFALTAGVLVGTYSSLFVAAPVMVHLENKHNQKLVEN
ncbi:MAG: protein translocase subunit SecF [Candidatus Marinimicrobia bacterium]|nr:protein translocase subunit SecF [Candidatus Neomarinimicrobiota bacterium]|tara:strand:- start:461 stop:1354 length:894 start_codon:yes stop_codon:yes gene_type:complete